MHKNNHSNGVLQIAILSRPSFSLSAAACLSVPLPRDYTIPPGSTKSGALPARTVVKEEDIEDGDSDEDGGKPGED